MIWSSLALANSDSGWLMTEDLRSLWFGQLFPGSSLIDVSYFYAPSLAVRPLSAHMWSAGQPRKAHWPFVNHIIVQMYRLCRLDRTGNQPLIREAQWTDSIQHYIDGVLGSVFCRFDSCSVWLSPMPVTVSMTAPASKIESSNEADHFLILVMLWFSLALANIGQWATDFYSVWV
jgi:hypothetical protein